MVKNNIKICLIASHTSVHTLRWLKFLIKKGFEVHLISFSPTRIEGAIVHSLNAKFSFGSLSKISPALPVLLDLRFIPKIKKILKKIKPDILHGHYLTCYAFFAACTGFHPLIVSIWGSDISTDPDKSWLLMLIVKYVFKKSDLVHVGDNVSKSRAIELGCRPNKIFIQPWGIDISKFSPDKKNQSLKEKLTIVDNYSIINTRCLDIKKYHVDIFIKAIPYVLKKIKNIKFIFAAKGQSKSELQQLVNQLNVKKNVLFLDGIPQKEMAKYLSSVDLCVDTYFPNNNKGGGGVGLSTMEAMSCATPQIMPQTPSMLKVNNWFKGLSYKCGDPEDLAKKIIYLLSDKKTMAEVGLKSRKSALKFFDLEKNMNDWKKVYYKLIKNKNNPSI